MTSSATRRKQRRELERAHNALGRETWSDQVFGIDVRQWRGHGGYRVRVKWLVDDDPFSALMALERLRNGVLKGLEQELVVEARSAGISWEDLGFALNLTGEAVRKRHARLDQALDR